MLAAPPLCMEWLPVSKTTENDKGNLLAVGTMMPQIEIWNLDVIDTV
jgi:periodic tryptophan protein 1